MCRALRDDRWLLTLTAQTCKGASDKEYDKHLLSPHTTLDSHPSKDKVRNGFAWGPGLPREPLISAALIKSLGPSGRFPHSSLRPRVAGTRAEAHGASPDTSSLVDTVKGAGPVLKSTPSHGNTGCRPLHSEASQNAHTATLSPVLTTASQRGRGSNPCHSHFQMRRLSLKAFSDFPKFTANLLPGSLPTPESFLSLYTTDTRDCMTRCCGGVC